MGKILIDANALKNAMYSIQPIPDSEYIFIDVIIEEIDNAHTVDAVEVVHGRWEDRENPQWRAYDIRHCSVCGWNIPKNNLRKKDRNWNYCPNCGAKMDG